MTDCLNGLVGITDITGCPCLDVDKPSFDNSSVFGYYLTDTDYGFPLKESILASSDCSDGSFWSTMLKARTSGMNSIKTDFTAALRNPESGVKSNLQTFNGLIGQIERLTYKKPTQAFAGIQLRPKPLRDAYFVITAIHTGFQAAGTIDLKITASDAYFAEQTVTLNTVENGWHKTTLPTPIKLPFYSKYQYANNNTYNSSQGLRYSFSYPSGSHVPLANRFDCGCTGSIAPYKTQMDVGCFDSATVEETTQKEYAGNCAYGISLEGFFTCDEMNFICEYKEQTVSDSSGSYYVADVFARTLQFAGGMYLAQHVLDSENISFYTSFNKEKIYGRKAFLKKRYYENINWLAQNIPHGISDCFSCDSLFTRRSY